MKATLYLSDGTSFEWQSFGYEASTAGELVFNTGMVWYPETLTDPSYHGQILISTYPLQWNYWIPEFENFDSYGIRKTFESDKIHLNGFIVWEYSNSYNHWEADSSLSDFLKSQKVPGITGIDTRQLTKIIRDKWNLLWKIIIWDHPWTELFTHNRKKEFLDYVSRDFVSWVSRKEVQIYGEGEKKICVLDMWVKNNIIRSLLKYDTTLIVVPHDFPFMNGEIEFDGLFISNGPGDPAQNTHTIEEIKKAIHANVPTFGICLGNQLIALASGAKTYKLKFGHRGQNQPCKDLTNGKCVITSQNHGYAIDESTLPKNIKPWFKNINDESNEWILFTNKNIRSVQFHPESFPGPTDSEYLFKEFVEGH